MCPGLIPSILVMLKYGWRPTGPGPVGPKKYKGLAQGLQETQGAREAKERELQCKSQGARVWLGVICFRVEYKKFLVNNTRHKAQIYIHTQSDGLLPAAFCCSFLLLLFLSLNRGRACTASSCSLTNQSLARSQAIGHKQLLAITFALLARKQSIARTQSQAAARSQTNLSLSITSNWP